MKLTSRIGPKLDTMYAFLGQARWTFFEIILIAIPIVIITVTAAVRPGSDKSYFDVIVAKPEWYFISLLFSLEALRDGTRYRDLRKQEEFASHLNASLAFTVVSAMLAAFATLDSLGIFAAVSQIATPAKETHLGTLDGLHTIAIPLFLFMAVWSGGTKIVLKRAEYQQRIDYDAIASIRRPRLFRFSDTRKVTKFYNLVAPTYDRRNEKAKGIKAAQKALVDAIRRRLRAVPSGGTLSVLDIGGGTGTNVYGVLNSELNLRWTYLDISEAMANRFREDFSAPDLANPPRILVGDCLDLNTVVPTEGFRGVFDIVVISFTLTSTQKDLDFSYLSTILKPDGAVLIADIHPGYVTKSSFFDVLQDNETLLLELRKVETLVLEQEARNGRLSRTAWELFPNERAEIYSFFMTLSMAQSLD